MKFKILCCLCCLCCLCLLALAGCSKPESTNSENLTTALEINQQNEIKSSLAYKLLTVERANNEVSINDPDLERINLYLTEISSLTQLPINVIGDMAWAGTSAINKNGRVVSVFDTLDMLRRVLPYEKEELEVMDAKKVMSSTIAHYGVVRLNTNQNHEVAVSSLINILETMKKPEFAEAMNKMMNQS